MINIHHHATKPLPNLMLVDIDRCVATYADIRHLTLDYEQITNYGGWKIGDEVGDYICSYDDFQQHTLNSSYRTYYANRRLSTLLQNLQLR